MKLLPWLWKSRYATDLHTNYGSENLKGRNFWGWRIKEGVRGIEWMK
jgi:hypothetical protein